MLATVLTADLCALTKGVRVEGEDALREYAADIFRNYPHANSVRAETDTERLYIYRNGIGIIRAPKVDEGYPA